MRFRRDRRQHLAGGDRRSVREGHADEFLELIANPPARRRLAAIVSAAPRAPGLARRLFAGVGAQGGATLASILGQAASVPVFLSAWGAEVYADWLVLSAAAGLLGLADLGVHGYASNGLRAAWARGDELGGRRILQTGMGCHLIIGLLLIAIIAAAASSGTAAQLGASSIADPDAVLTLLGLAAVALLPRGLAATIHSARNRFHREVGGLALAQALQTAAGILTALAGGAPLHAAAAQLVGVLIGWIALLWDIRRLDGDLPLRPQAPTLEELRRLAARAPFYAVSHSGVTLMVYVPVVLLGRFANAAEVVSFSAVRTLIGLVRQVGRQIATSLGLETARMHACGDAAAARRFYTETSCLPGTCVGLAAGAVWIAGPAIFELWTGGRIAFDPALALAFLIGALLQAPAYSAYSLLRLVDRPAAVAAAQAVEIAVAAGLGAVLIPAAGAAGAAAAISAAEVFVSSPWLIRVAERLLAGAPPLRPVRVLAAALTAFAAAAPIWAAIERGASLMELTAAAVLSAGGSALALVIATTAAQRRWAAARILAVRVLPGDRRAAGQGKLKRD